MSVSLQGHGAALVKYQPTETLVLDVSVRAGWSVARRLSRLWAKIGEGMHGVAVDQRRLRVLWRNKYEFVLMPPLADRLEKVPEPFQSLALSRSWHTVQQGTGRLRPERLGGGFFGRFRQAPAHDVLQEGQLLRTRARRAALQLLQPRAGRLKRQPCVHASARGLEIPMLCPAADGGVYARGLLGLELAERIRSFPVVPFVGTEWLTQLDTATQQRKKIRRQDHGGAHFKHSELYGWRGTDPRVYHLSPWEFMKWWELKRLQPPTTSEEGAERGLSEWVPGHAQSVAQPEAAMPAKSWKFGEHYRWRDPLPAHLADNILRLPSKIASQAAAAHYLQRRREPVVPFPCMCPLPKSDMSPDAQARLFNVYLRPWTLDVKDASLHAPHIDSLDLPISALQATIPPARRLRTKTAPAERSHAAAWKDYVESHVVSEHAARTIRNFVAAAECGADAADVEAVKTERHCAAAPRHGTALCPGSSAASPPAAALCGPKAAASAGTL